LSWAGFFSASDSRFKTDIQDINDSSALDLLRKLNQRHTNILIKLKEVMTLLMDRFTAQQIADVFPNCVPQRREKISNIYESCIYVDNVITLTNKTVG
jgi:hypothetical protein